MRRVHDMGGMMAGPIDRSEKGTPGWARLSEALRVLVNSTYCLHEQRRRIEDFSPEDYARLSYYELRITAMADALTERNIIGEDELAQRMGEIRKRDAK